ncbi:hypothetical protein ACRCUN_06355 [Mycobacterium sp. LTG2003]
MSNDHFSIIDETIAPQPWTQYRILASKTATSVSRSYDTSGGGNKNDLVHTVDIRWTNNTPMLQHVYGMVTRGGAQVALQARSRGYIAMSHGVTIQRELLVTDFETDAGGFILPAAFVLTSDQKASGQRSLRMNANPAVQQAHMGTAVLDVTPGDAVRMSFKARRTLDYNGTNPNAKLRIGDATNALIATLPFGAAALPIPLVWADQSQTFTVPAGVTQLRVRIDNDATNGTVWLDELEIVIDRTGPLDMREVSRFGCGLDVGKGGILALGSGFAVHEIRQNSSTAPLMPHDTGWDVVEPGFTFVARVELRFKSEFWENTAIDGGDQNTESGFISGDTRVDLYGIPTVATPEPRPVPIVVGVEHSTNNTFPTDVDVPTGTAEGDVMLAIVANNIGLASDINPQEDGWTLWHVRNDGLAGIGDVHMKVYWRIASSDEPDSYHFTTGILAEEIVHLVVVRNAALDLDDGWQIASTLRRFFWERDDGHIAPSIDRAGQLLICASYFAHSPLQAPINQAPPDDMVELSDVDAEGSSMAVAVLASPPRPTRERMFVPTKTPQWSGRSIAVSILVPGVQTF